MECLKLRGFLQKLVKSRNYYFEFLLQTDLTELLFVQQLFFQDSVSKDLTFF